jgi:hypothetical protein
MSRLLRSFLPVLSVLASLIAALHFVAAQPLLTVYPSVPLRVPAMMGDSGSVQLMLANEGSTRVRIFTAEIIGGDAGLFSLSGDATVGVHAGTFLLLHVGFAPVGNADGHAALRLVCATSRIDTLLVPLLGVSLPAGHAAVTLSPAEIHAPAQLVGDTWEALCTLRNPTADTLRPGNPFFLGADAPAFSLVAPPSLLLAPGASATLRLRCTHAAEETLRTMLVVPWNDTLAATLVAELSWRLRRPRLWMTDNPWHISGVMATETIRPSTYFRNNGTTPLYLRNFSLTGPAANEYTLLLPDSLELGADQSVRATFIFTPSVAGLREAELHFDSNDPDIPHPVLQLKGYADEYRRPHIVTSHSEMQFGSVYIGWEDRDTLTIHNTGNADLYIHNVENQGDIHPDYDPCELILDPFEPLIVRQQDSLNVVVTFRPTKHAYCRSRLVYFSDDPKNPKHIVRVTGNGRLPPTIDTDPDFLLFPSVPPGDSLDLPLRILSKQNFLADVFLASQEIIGTDADCFRVVDPLPPDARIHGSEEVTLRYYQRGEASRVAFLRLRSNDPLRPVLDVPLAGFSFNVSGTPESDVPHALALQAWPNPFTSTLTVAAVFTGTSTVSLEILDIAGRVQKTLAHEIAGPGDLLLPFDGSALPPGVYVLRLRNGSSTRHLRLLKF